MVYNISVSNDTLSGGEYVDEKILLELRKTPLLEKADEDVLRRALSFDSCFEKTYEKGDTILSPDDIERRIIIILGGKAAVYSPDIEKNVLLRTLGVGDIFGVANLFGPSSSFVTHIIAKSKCRVFMISSRAISYLLENDKCFMYSYLSFLSSRICFLNRKIKVYTSGSAERRIALYLLSFGADTITPTIPMNSLAELLDIGRASLYRGMEKLSSDGFIARDGDKIKILDRQRMMKHFN